MVTVGRCGSGRGRGIGRLARRGRGWPGEDGDGVLLGLDATRARLKHRRADPLVSLTALSAASWYTQVSVQGRVVSIVDDGGLQDTDRLSRHYTGDAYPDRERPRVTAQVEIARWHAWGDLRHE